MSLNKLHGSIRAKLAALSIGTSVAALLVASAAYVYYDRVTSAETKLNALTSLTHAVARAVEGPVTEGDRIAALTALDALAVEPTVEEAAVYTREGALLVEWRKPGATRTLPDQLASFEQVSAYRDDALHVVRDVGSPRYAGTLHAVYATDDLAWRTAHQLAIAAGALLFATLLGLFAAQRARDAFTAPLARLTQVARKVHQRRSFAQRVETGDPEEPGELGQLTETINAMLETLEVRDRELEKHRQSLEQLAEQRTHALTQKSRDARAILDALEQGVVVLDGHGVPSVERNATFDQWFGAPDPGQTFGQIVARRAAGFDVQFAMQWEQVTLGFLPIELALAQLPDSVATGDGRHLQIRYRILATESERLSRLLVLLSDKTDQVERAESEAEQQQLYALLDNITADRGGFLSFFRETEATLASLLSGGQRDLTHVMRDLHSLKANFALFGLKPLARLANEIEDGCEERGAPPDLDDRLALSEAWGMFADRARTLLGEHAHVISVERAALERLVDAIRQRRPEVELLGLAERLTQEPVAPKLARLGERARALAARLGKGPVEVDVQAEGVVAPPNLNWLWQVLPHVVANSVDHGLDAIDERSARGKQTPSKLRIAAIEHPSGLVVEIQDDGRGIDWNKVRERAKRLGLPCTTHDELVAALFSDGVTTREQATDLSGRGVGLAAVEAACHEHGASIGIESEPGKGTLFRVVVSNDNAEGVRSGAA